MAQRIDGKAVGEKVREEVKARALAFAAKYGRKPALHVVLVGDDPASHVYVRNKELAAGKAELAGEVHRLPADTTQSDLVALVRKLNAAPDIDGILVQLPLPKHLEAEPVLDAIDPSKDVDGLHPMNAGLLTNGRKGLRACTPSGCMRLLAEVGCDPSGKRAVVIGRSILVGKPMASLLLEKNATVTVAHSRTQDLAAVVREADIVIAAVGKAKLVKKDWVKPGAVVLDVGTNKGEDGKLVGDVDYDGVFEVASAVSPVPGGVGPMTIAMLLENTVLAAELRAAR